MATLKRYMLDGDVVPQAIFWRPLKYFSITVCKGEDELDLFEVASFTIGNDVHFDLRTYRKHYQFMVTLYLPGDLEEDAEISRLLSIVIEELAVPKNAVAWRRGEPFAFGKLERPQTDWLREKEARIIALKIASQRPNRTASTEEIKREVPSYIALSCHDLAQSNKRPREKMWQQIVGNVISHKASRSGVFLNGFARRTFDGLSVTDKGIDYLRSIGFLDAFAAFVE